MGKCWGHSDQGAANRKGAAQWRYTPVQTTPGYLLQQSRPHSGFTAVSVPFVQQRVGLAQLPPRYVKVNSAPPVRSFPLFSLRAHHQRQSSPPVPRTGRAMFCNVFTFLPRPSGPLHRKQPQRSAPAHQTPRGSRQRAGIAARGLALPRRQQRDEVVDKWRQAQQPPPARHQRAGN